MPKETYRVHPLTDLTLPQLNRLVIDLNTVLANISQQLATIEGRDGRTPVFSNDIDLSSKRIKNVGRTQSMKDAPNVEELVEKALYAIGNRHVASRLIEAQGGITVPRAESGPDAIPLEQLLEEIDIAIGSLVTGPASATDNAVVRFDGATGKTIQDSGVIIDDSDNVLVPGEMEIDGFLDHDGLNVGFYGTAPATQAAAQADVTGTAGGATDGAMESIPDPADTPADADTLRDDLVANALPAIRNNIDEIRVLANKALGVLRGVGLMAT